MTKPETIAGELLALRLAAAVAFGQIAAANADPPAFLEDLRQGMKAALDKIHGPIEGPGGAAASVAEIKACAAASIDSIFAAVSHLSAEF